MTTAFYNTAQHPVYGAAELKRLAGKHTMYGLFLSVGIVGAVFLVVYAFVVLTASPVPHVVLPPKIEINIKLPRAVPKDNGLSQGASSSDGSRAIADPLLGVIPVPVDIPHTLPVDGGDIDSPFDLLPENGNGSGDGGGDDLFGNNGIISNGGTNGNGGEQEQDDEDLAFELIPDVLPTVDESGLRSAVVYPAIAKRMRLDGKVVVMVLIDVQGSPVAVSIASSTNEIFNQAALDAVAKATFRPAYRNGQPVQFRLYVPIEFKMK